MMPETVKNGVVAQATALRAARLERGWDIAGLMLRLRQAAMQQGVELPDNPQLRARVRQWEDGQAPRERNQLLLAHVYGMSPAALGMEPARDATPEIDGERWGRIVARYRQWVLHTFRGVVRDHNTAEDLTQDLFIRVGRSLHKLDPTTDGHLYPYLNLQIRWTLTAHFSSLRDNREHLASASTDSDQPSALERAATDELSCTEELASTLTDVRGLLSSLPGGQCEVLALRFLEDLRGDQIAVRLGISLSQVHKRMAQGMKALRAQMGVGELDKPRPAEDGGLWAAGARQAVLDEAASGRRFTTADLIERYELAAPDVPQKWIHVLAALKRDGVIEEAGCEGPRGRRRRVYIGIPRELAVAKASAVVAAVAA